MTRHRAESHSLFYLTLAAPVLAGLVSRVHSEAALFKRWWLALWLTLVTHPLLDTMTVYGTQLLQPFSDYPFGVGSVFIIDPAYTLPLIVGVAAALRLKSERGLRWNAAGLLLSTLYLGLGVLAQQHATKVARASLQTQGIAAQELLVTPTPFNAVLWRLVATTPSNYLEGYYSLLDGTKDDMQTIRWTVHPRGQALMASYGDAPSVRRIAAFSHGFFRLSEEQGHLFVTDLRMGMEPYYSFHFDLGPTSSVATDGTKPVQQSQRPPVPTTLQWLWRRMLGDAVPPPA